MSIQLKKYEFGIDVRKLHHIYGKNDKIISLGEWIENRREKCIIIEMITNIGKREAFFYQELNNHNHIIHTFGSINNNLERIIYIQEYALHGDLSGLLLDTHLSQIILIEIFQQIADGMIYIANKSIVHADLGCRNILIFKLDQLIAKNNLIKITDFGLAHSHKNLSTFDNLTIIPKRYCALEILRNNHRINYTEKSDVYSMGVLMWEALSNSEIPYSYIADDQQVEQIKLNNKKLTRPFICDDQLWSLIESCWDNNRDRRPNFEQIKDTLSIIKPSETSNIRQSILLYEPSIGYKFELNTDVTRNDLLGGKFRKIYNAQWTSRREKSIVMIEIDEIPTEYEILFYDELNNHPHIIHTFGFVQNNFGLILLLQERAPYGHLQELLINNKFKPSTTVLIEIFLQIINAMIYILSKNMIHGDLRCSNILVFQMNSNNPKENYIKLTNFSLVYPNDSSLPNDRRLTIPIQYCAPEILRSAGRLNYSELSDIYSMGVLMREANSQGKSPYESSISNKEIRQMKLNSEILPRPWMCDGYIWSIIKDCWYNEPQLRHTFNGIKILLSSINFESRYQYELDADIRMGNRFHSTHGQIFYNAEWIKKKHSSIILIEINRKTAEREASFYIELSSHKHIVQTFGLIKTNLHSIMLIQERAPHGNLLTLLQNKQFQPSAKILVTIFLQIIEAMIYMTEKDIIHGDLRCANVLVFQMNSFEAKDNLVKLTNFSLMCTNDPSFINDRQISIPIRYSAPEIIESTGQSNYSELSDVYSMGVLMWEVCSQGEIPYGSHTNDNDIRRQKLNGEKLSKPHKCNIEIWDIMKDCWYNEPQLRFNFNDMKKRLSAIKFESVLLENSKYKLDVNVKKKNSLNGHYGKFYEADWIGIKERPIILMIMNEETADREASWYLKFNSQRHIIHTFGFVENIDRLPMLLQERAAYGNLQTLLQSKRFQPSSEVFIEIFSQILDAMIYIANQDVIHGDLRCSNVLVFQMNSTKPSENLVKLTNFSMTRTKDFSYIDHKRQISSIRYCAYEILISKNQSDYSKASDVYSFGVLMWEACSQGEIPYGSHTSDDDIRQRRLNGETLKKPNGCKDQIWNIIEHCLYMTPEMRDTMEEIKRKFSDIHLDQINVIQHDNNYKQNLDNSKVSYSSGSASIISPKKTILQDSYQRNPVQKPKKLDRPSSPVISEPTLSIQCKHCNKTYLSNELDTHEQSCSSNAQLPSNVSNSSNLWERFCSCLPWFHNNKP